MAYASAVDENEMLDSPMCMDAAPAVKLASPAKGGAAAAPFQRSSKIPSLGAGLADRTNQA